MGNILTAQVTVVGTRPLLWHAFGPDAIPLEKREKTGVAGNDPEEWKRTVLVEKDGRLYLEPTYIFGCVRDGAKYTPKKRGTLQPIVASTLQIVDERVYTDRVMPDPLTTDTDQPVYLDIRSVKNPATRGRNVRYRIAASKGWSVTFGLLWDKTIVSTQELRAILTDAGNLVGLGDGRSIGMGRFTVDAFTVSE
jgi:hypothetical protein